MKDNSQSSQINNIVINEIKSIKSKDSPKENLFSQSSSKDSNLSIDYPNSKTINKTIIFLGNSKSGKTSILTRFTKKKFKENYIETIGVDYYSRQNETEYGLVLFHLWDTNGEEEKYRILPNNIYKTVNSFMIVVSYDDSLAIKTLSKLIKYALSYKDNINRDSFLNYLIPIYIVINKCDIPDKERKFTIAEVHKITDEFFNLRLKFIEVSAKENKRIDFLFLNVTVQLFGTYSDEKLLVNPDLNLTFDTLVNPKKKQFRISIDKSKKKKKKCC